MEKIISNSGTKIMFARSLFSLIILDKEYEKKIKNAISVGDQPMASV